jgi:hypothetical protein
MARYDDDDSPRNYPQGQPIVIERRTIVGTIEPDPRGTVSMLTAAFHLAGEYLSDHDDEEGISLDFTSFGRTFHAVSDPVAE